MSRDLLHAAASSRAEEGGASVREDCVRHDLARLAVQEIDGDVKITVGQHWVMSFGTNRREAERTSGILRAYDATHMCYVGRPDPSLTYVLAGGSAPTGAVAGEDCIRHDLGTLFVQR